jgi:excisionase family DNA binding protein
MPTETVIRLSVSEAAKLFGVSLLTIRRAIKAKEITYVVIHNRYKISFESLVKWSQRTATIRNKMQSRGIGQFVDVWKIKNTLYSPNPSMYAKRSDNSKEPM